MRNCLLHPIYALLLGILFFFPSLAIADEGTLPAEMFSAIMLKALNYDRNIDRQAKDKVIIGIVYLNNDTRALDFVNPVKNYVTQVQSSITLKDKPVQVITLTLTQGFDKAWLEGQLKENNISVLIVAIRDSASVSNIIEVTRKLQVSSICPAPQCAQGGIGLEIIKRDEKPKMIINIDSIKQEGSDYNSKFLTMCEVQK